MTTDTREALADLVLNISEAMRTGGWIPTPLHESFWEAMSNASAALAVQAAQPSAQGEAVARIDPMQNPMRPGVFMNYAKDETPAEMVLRKLACWLGVGGYNATTVDAEAFHRKIVEGVQMLVASASAPAAPAQAVPLTDEQIQRVWQEQGGIARPGWIYSFARAIERAAHRLNGIAPKAAQEK